MCPYRLAYLVSHPIQYQAPLLRYLSEQPELSLKVFFLSDLSTRNYFDSGFGARIQWDVPLLDGYDYEFLPAVGRTDRLNFWVPFSWGLRQAIRQGFDAVWIHGYAHQANLRTVLIAKQSGLKVFLRGESNLRSSKRGVVKRLLKECALRPLFRSIDGFLSIGEANTAYYRHYSVPQEKIFPMPYAVDNQFFQTQSRAASSRREEFRSSLGLDPGRSVILYASKLVSWKRPRDLWMAYKLLSKDGKKEPSPYLIFVGEGDERAALEAETRRTGWLSVKFLGFRNQTELPAFYDLCDVFVLPSEHEPWGLVVNEVMNGKRPVIVSDQVGAAADLVHHGETGFVYPIGDVDALATCLRTIVKNPDLARIIGERARTRVSLYDFTTDWQGLHLALRKTVER